MEFVWENIDIFLWIKKLSHLLYDVYVTVYLGKHSTKPVLANIPKQSKQSCTLLGQQFAPRFHRDLMTGWSHIEIRLN